MSNGPFCPMNSNFTFPKFLVKELEILSESNSFGLTIFFSKRANTLLRGTWYIGNSLPCEIQFSTIWRETVESNYPKTSFSHGQDNLKDNGAQGPMKAQRAGGGLKTGPNVTGGRQNARHHHPPKTTNHPTYTRVSRLQDPDLISLTLGLL